MATTKKKSSLAKAQATRTEKVATGTGGVKPARVPLPTFTAPADFAPHFLEVVVTTEEDGLLASQIEATRYIGRYNPEAEDKKKRNLAAYDMRTLLAIQARLAAVTFKPTNDKKFPAKAADRAEGVKGSMRLPANKTFKLVLRANKKKDTGALAVRVVSVSQDVKLKSGVVKSVELTKLDPVARMFKRAARFLPAAFQNVQAPPKLRRGRAASSDDE
ncbi:MULTISPECIES: hypothetical protein [Bacteria]|jgi:hypothetical protein|uniref:Uncharacterized protein n=16 Tax=root TaxID=1 RepID=A0A8S5UHV4_9CAUD|nr:hypothetical protein [Enterococcus faecalis]ELG7156228.1 hypothetical protein [Staphylococcus aureus]DAF94064.1 MAG TPA: hypothetical protein [Myoviridae sp. ctu2j3]HDW3906765.1 hypothetical protein [Escherichia coli]ELL1201282.1 hypothetical protein [Staphylococcus aureus]MDN3098592.1 hypothetical protein [Enterococcus faecalis]